MSSTSPFKKKEPREPMFIQNMENIQNMPKTFKQLQQQKTYRTIMDSDVHYNLGQSRKTIVSQMRQGLVLFRESRKESLGVNDDLLKLREAQIVKLEQSLFLEKGINECLREEIYKNKERIHQLVQQLDQGNNKSESDNQNPKEHPKLIGILKNNKKQQLNQTQTLRFGAPKLYKKSKTPLELQNKRLRQYIQNLQQNFVKCKYLLEDMEEKSKIIQEQYESQIKALKMSNQYLKYQIRQFN